MLGFYTYTYVYKVCVYIYIIIYIYKHAYTCANAPNSAFMNFASRLRAVLAAARFCDTLAEEGLEGRSGVATGTVWCGTDLSLMRDEGMIVRCLQMMMLTCYCRIGIWKYFLKLEAS